MEAVPTATLPPTIAASRSEGVSHQDPPLRVCRRDGTTNTTPTPPNRASASNVKLQCTSVAPATSTSAPAYPVCRSANASEQTNNPNTIESMIMLSALPTAVRATRIEAPVATAKRGKAHHGCRSRTTAKAPALSAMATANTAGVTVANSRVSMSRTLPVSETITGCPGRSGFVPRRSVGGAMSSRESMPSAATAFAR